MSEYCNVCGDKGAKVEHLTDGRPIPLCRICRSYLQGLLRTCHNCDYEDVCILRAANYKIQVCKDWHKKAGSK